METPSLELEPNVEEYVNEQWRTHVLPNIDPELHLNARHILLETMSAYAEPHRKYHDLEHIAETFKLLEPYADREDHLQIFLALLWHDVVYDTHSGTNEEDSAAFAFARMDALGLPGKETVKRLILATKSHRADAEDAQLVCAIDMAILGAEQDKYIRYTEQIRQEYDWVPEDIFRMKRSEVLEQIIGNDVRPFKHPDFQHLNAPAVRNISDEVALLSD